MTDDRSDLQLVGMVWYSRRGWISSLRWGRKFECRRALRSPGEWGVCRAEGGAPLKRRLTLAESDRRFFVDRP